MGKMKILGSSLCKEVTYKIEAIAKQFYFCHCEQCRKPAGFAHDIDILTEGVPVYWSGDEEQISSYDMPEERQFAHVYCRKCGSGLSFKNVNDSISFTPAGSPGKDTKRKVTPNIFWAKAPQWTLSGLAAKRYSVFHE